jgi:hypothetical protein
MSKSDENLSELDKAIRSRYGLSWQEVESIRREPPQIMTENQMAAFLSVSPRLVRSLRQSCTLPHFRLRGRILFRTAEALKAIERREVRAV